MDLRNKIKRLRRLQNVEQRKLDLLAVELKELDLVLSRQTELLSRIHQQIEQGASYQGNGVESARQAIVWVEALFQRVERVKQAINETSERKNELVAKLAEQRAAIRGWELLIERLDKQLLHEQENEAARIADDRFLGTQMVSER